MFSHSVSARRGIPGRFPLGTFLVRTRKVPRRAGAKPRRLEKSREEVKKILDSYGPGPGHVFNLGHGIQTGINPENVAAMVAAVHELSPTYHK